MEQQRQFAAGGVVDPLGTKPGKCRTQHVGSTFEAPVDSSESGAVPKTFDQAQHPAHIQPRAVCGAQPQTFEQTKRPTLETPIDPSQCQTESSAVDDHTAVVAPKRQTVERSKHTALSEAITRSEHPTQRRPDVDHTPVVVTER